MSGKISSSMKWTLEEVNLVSEFGFHVQLVWRQLIYIYIYTYSHAYIFIPIFNVAYPVYVLCNLRLTCPYWGPIQFRIMNPCFWWFFFCLAQTEEMMSLLSCWAGRQLLVPYDLGKWCERAKEMCWFVVSRVGSIPTHHKSVCGTSLKFFKVQEYSLVTNLTSELIGNT